MFLTSGKIISAIFFIVTMVFGVTTFAQNTSAITGMIYVTPNMVKWAPAPSNMPKGAMIAVLEGDPSKPGPYVIRLNLPENSVFPPHTHPDVEQVTVISGDLYLGLGDVIDLDRAVQLTAGSFAYIQPGTHHYAFTKGAAIIQLHGMGPWAINYINSQK